MRSIRFPGGLACAALALATIQACGVDQALAPPKTVRFICYDSNILVGVLDSGGVKLSTSDPTAPQAPPPGCEPPPPAPETLTPIETEMSVLGAGHYYPGGSYSYTFYGQSFSFNDVAASTGSWSACPDVLMNVSFRMTTPSGVIEKFQSVGMANKIGDYARLADNYARSKYQLPFERVYSQSGQYYITGGTIKVVCIQGRFAFIIGSWFNEIDVSQYVTYSFEGDIYPSLIAQFGPTSGWTVYNSSTGWSNGSSAGWGAALNNFLATGGCEVGWDVWVDGAAVCKNGVRQT